MSYDNASDNPIYGMSVHDGNTLSGVNGVSKLKIEEEPCPLYEDLDKLGMLEVLHDKNYIPSAVIMTSIMY